jgi:hypothetical protein
MAYYVLRDVAKITNTAVGHIELGGQVTICLGGPLRASAAASRHEQIETVFRVWYHPEKSTRFLHCTMIFAIKRSSVTKPVTKSTYGNSSINSINFRSSLQCQIDTV